MIAAVQTSFTLRILALVVLSAATSAAAQTPAARTAAPLTAQDYIDIQQLLNRYAFALDTCSNNGYDYADLYTPDGVFYWGIGARKSVGREELAEAAGGGKQRCQKLKSANRENPIQTHMTVNAIIEPSPEGATGIQYAEAVNFGERDKKTPTEMDHFLWYEDVYVKTPDGWRFKSRAIHGENGALKKPFVPPAAETHAH